MRNLKELKSLLIQRVDVQKFYKDYLDLNWPGTIKDTTVKCVFHEDSSPSLWISRDGKFKCMTPSCGARGNSTVNFLDQLRGDYKTALRELYGKYIAPVIPKKIIKGLHRTLLDSPNVLTYLEEKRGLTNETIQKFELGFDGDRITIPIFNEFDLCVNIRKYDWTKKSKHKMLSWKAGYGGTRLFPISSVESPLCRTVLLVEGEFKAILASQHGYTAVSFTGGAGSWSEQDAPYFKKKSVRIVYDVNDSDDTGQVGAQKVAEKLKNLAANVRTVKLPLKEKGAGITEWFVSGRTREELDQLIHDTPFYVTSPEDSTEKDSAPTGHKKVRLDQASEAKYFGIPLEMNCLVAGKDLAPYLAPKRIDLSVEIKEGETIKETLTINHANREILRLISCSDDQVKGAIKQMFNVPEKARCKIKVLETFNIEEIRIIPSIDFESGDGKYVIRTAYYVGHGIEANKTYALRGFSVPDPKTQHATHLITEAVPAHDNIESFKFTPKLKQTLGQVFTPSKNQTCGEKILEIASWLSRHITKIKKRPDLHVAIDLVFHSVLDFNFNGENIHKGWLELLVIGDTRCGKGYVAERLTKFYQLGEVVSGENCSFAGLVGGLQEFNKRWIITWGKIALNDKRLVVIDEASAIPLETIGRMSRVRSEGIAEITKIQSEKTRARTRQIWLSNCRSGKAINTYNNGVEAILELMGNSEDVSRFDFAITVAGNEVSSSLINAPSGKEESDKNKYTSEDFRNLVLWAWSRKVDQIKFTKKATRFVLTTSVIMGRRYSPAIPLVQAENIRVKLAKLSVAVAARVFSTDPTGESILVKEEHVAYAYELLKQLYSKPSMAYDVFSQTRIEMNSLTNEAAVKKLINGIGPHREDFIKGFLESNQISVTDTSDYTNKDKYLAKELIGKLVRLRCLTKEYAYYVKRPAFITLLRNLRSEELNKEGS